MSNKTREQWVEEVMNQAEVYGLEMDDIETEKEKLRALLLEVPDPEGWKLTKIETTSGMLNKGVMKLLGCTASELDDYPYQTMIGYEHEVDDIFKVMIAASPEYKGE